MSTSQAVVTLDQAANSSMEAVKHRRISQRIKKACDLLVSGDAITIKEAAERVNLCREHLSRELSKSHVAEYLKQKACRALAIDAARAAAVKGQLLNADSESVRDQVSTYLLALAGIKPANSPQVSVNVELKAGYVLDLRDQPMPTIELKTNE